jgi:site-specific DNA-methyltransferase (adenine-specific)
VEFTENVAQVNLRIKAAFDAVRGDHSVDRLVADPELNARFVEKCRELGEPATLNRALLNLRKGGHLRGIKSNRLSAGDDDPYRFAAEMAVRYMERRDGVSLDDIICDPELASEFDRLAAAIAPGFTPLQYRWAAL